MVPSRDTTAKDFIDSHNGGLKLNRDLEICLGMVLGARNGVTSPGFKTAPAL